MIENHHLSGCHLQEFFVLFPHPCLQVFVGLTPDVFHHASIICSKEEILEEALIKVVGITLVGTNMQCTSKGSCPREQIMESNVSILDTEAAQAIVLLSSSLSMTATAAVSPYQGTPVDDTPTNHSLSSSPTNHSLSLSSLASAHPTKKSLPRLTEKDRRQH